MGEWGGSPIHHSNNSTAVDVFGAILISRHLYLWAQIREKAVKKSPIGDFLTACDVRCSN